MSFFFLFRKFAVVYLGVVLLSMLLIPVHAKNFPTATGFVTDCCSFLTKEERQTIDDTLSKYQQTTSNQIAVAIVKNLEGDSIESYGTELFRLWKIGEAKKNNGILLLFSLDEKKIRIEVGYGLEGAVTDALSAQIIRNEITPAMKQKKYADAVTKGVTALMKAAQGEYNVAAGTLYNGKDGAAGSASDDQAGSLLGGVLFLLFFLGNAFSYVAAYLARSKGIWAGGIGGGAIGLIVMLFLGLGIGTVILTGFLVIAGFVLDAILSANYSTLKTQGKSTRFWDSGGGFFSSRGGGSSGGGGFGGFGGGSSGGGGASGGW